jgi:lactoylglutathione lyase
MSQYPSHIEHVAIRTKNLEQLKTFYETYFQAKAGEKYVNARTRFESYFLSFSSGTRLELMRMPTLTILLSSLEV